MRKAVILGCSVLDLYVHVEKMPKGNEELTMKTPMMRPMGSALISAALLHGLHLPYSLNTTIGTGVYGVTLQDEVAKLGLSKGLFVDGVQGCSYTMIDAQGNTSTMLVPGVEYTCPNVVDGSESERDLCFFGGEGLAFEDAEAWIEAVRPFAGRFLFRPTQAGTHLDLLHMDEILKLNPILHLSDEEALSFARNPEGDLFQIARRIQKENNCTVLLALRDSSCLLLDEKQSIHVPPLQDLEIYDQSGAYDAHAAAFLAARMCGLKDQRAMEFAQRVYARVCERDTATLLEPALEQCRELLTRFLTEGSYRGRV